MEISGFLEIVLQWIKVSMETILRGKVPLKLENLVEPGCTMEINFGERWSLKEIGGKRETVMDLFLVISVNVPH